MSFSGHSQRRSYDFHRIVFTQIFDRFAKFRHMRGREMGIKVISGFPRFNNGQILILISFFDIQTRSIHDTAGIAAEE